MSLREFFCAHDVHLLLRRLISNVDPQIFLILFLAQGSRGNVQAAQGSAEQKHPKRYRSSFNSTVAYDSKYDLNDLSSRWRSL
jgi:hypothetical protein